MSLDFILQLMASLALCLHLALAVLVGRLAAGLGRSVSGLGRSGVHRWILLGPEILSESV